MKVRFTDIHHHLLWGMDDGPVSRRRMYDMIRRASEDGVNRIVVTPHVTPGVHPFKEAQFRQAIEDARAYCRENGLKIQFFEGAEILFMDQGYRFFQGHRVPTLAGTNMVLVEFPTDIRLERMRTALGRMVKCGYVPVLAHVERYRCLVLHPRKAMEMRDELNLCFQVNCSTIIHPGGWIVGRFVRKLLAEGALDVVASDAHNTGERRIRMRAAWKVLKRKYGTAYARMLVDGSLLFGEK